MLNHLRMLAGSGSAVLTATAGKRYPARLAIAALISCMRFPEQHPLDLLQ
jgi:hypothetical protein